MRAKPAAVNGVPRSEVNTNGESGGSCSRCSRRNVAAIVEERPGQFLAEIGQLASRPLPEPQAGDRATLTVEDYFAQNIDWQQARRLPLRIVSRNWSFHSLQPGGKPPKR